MLVRVAASFSRILVNAWPQAIEAVNDRGKTPLHFAAARGQARLLEMMVQAPGEMLLVGWNGGGEIMAEGARCSNTGDD